MTWFRVPPGNPPRPAPMPEPELTSVAVGESAAAAALVDAADDEGEGKMAAELWGSDDPRAHEYWCSDYVIALWHQAGADVTGLTNASGTFAEYLGHTLSATPHVGDAVVFNYAGAGTGKADHVAIVTAVDGDTITTVSGDWSGHGDTMDAFATSAHVIKNQPYSDTLDVPVPQMPGEHGPMQISGFMSPVPLQSPDNGVVAGLRQLPVAVAGASFHLAGLVVTGNDRILVGTAGLPLAGQGDQVEGGGYVHDQHTDNVYMGRRAT